VSGSVRKQRLPASCANGQKNDGRGIESLVQWRMRGVVASGFIHAEWLGRTNSLRNEKVGADCAPLARMRTRRFLVGRPLWRPWNWIGGNQSPLTAQRPPWSSTFPISNSPLCVKNVMQLLRELIQVFPICDCGIAFVVKRQP